MDPVNNSVSGSAVANQKESTGTAARSLRMTSRRRECESRPACDRRTISARILSVDLELGMMHDFVEIALQRGGEFVDVCSGFLVERYGLQGVL